MRKRDIFYYAALCFTFLLLLIPDICRGLDPPAPLPKSGQTQCWDTAGTLIDCAGTGQDGDHQAGVAWPDPRFRDHGDGTVTDNLTGLLWTKDADLGGQLQWYDAIDFCEGLSLGQNDWRLPNKNELHSLMSFGTYDPVLPIGHPFINVQSDFYWIGTNMQGDGTRAWNLGLEFGHVHYWSVVKADPYNVLCVSKGESVSTEDAPAPVPKTGQTYCTDLLGNTTSCPGTGQDGDYQMGVADPDPRFTDNGDGTITDNLTGLVWTKDSNIAGESMLWQEALDFCEDLSLGACGDNWRLPNLMETRSLSDYDFLLPSLPNGHPFTNVVMPMYYWTSSTVVDQPSHAYTENVGWGLEDYFLSKINDVYTQLAPTAWCVCEGTSDSCPIVQIYGAHSEETELLRNFRDTILSKSPAGQELIKLYYQLSPALAKAVAGDEKFKEQVKEMVGGVLMLITKEAN
jgi:hypothetical protein